MKIERIVFVLIIIVLGCFCFYLWQDRNARPISENSTTPAEISVDVLQLREKNISITKPYVGYIEAISSVQVKPFLSGFIESVHIKAGQPVMAGEVLFTLKQDEYKAALNSALAVEKQAFDHYTAAGNDYKRAQKAGIPAISETEMDQAKTAYLTAKSAVDKATADVQSARVNLNYTFITAPISGIIGNMLVTKGDYVSPSSMGLVNLIQQSPMRLVFSIPAKDYLKEKQENAYPFQDWSVHLFLANGLEYPLTGKVQFLDNVLSGDTNALPVYTDMENLNNQLIAGSYINIILEKKIKNAICVPQNTVYFDKQVQPYVYIIGPNGFIQKQAVIVGPSVDNQYQITDGLQAGELLVLQNVTDSMLNQKVNPVLEPAQ